MEQSFAMLRLLGLRLERKSLEELERVTGVVWQNSQKVKNKCQLNHGLRLVNVIIKVIVRQ